MVEATVRCFKCHEPRHKSSDCPKRKFVGDEEDDDDTQAEDDEVKVGPLGVLLQPVKFLLVLIICQILYTPAQPDESQRHRILEGKCPYINMGWDKYAN